MQYHFCTALYYVPGKNVLAAKQVARGKMSTKDEHILKLLEPAVGVVVPIHTPTKVGSELPSTVLHFFSQWLPIW